MAPSTTRQQPVLASFPFLTVEEFDSACCQFCDRVQVLEDSLNVHFTRRAVGPILSIRRRIADVSVSAYDVLCLADESIREWHVGAYEDDPEALIHIPESSVDLDVIYDVHLSPIYHVPVLYFTLRPTGHPGQLGIDAVYQYLVPNQYRKELQSVGVMGGISLGYHPETGSPTFVVHPCNTADAMRQIAGHQRVTPETYLILWLGLVGNHLGLQLPMELFAADEMERIPRS
ncbi:ATG3/ATG10 family protein [Aspergillus saccharolyticus JOP 1030-1]|uniref:Ubiquitin-like-conjugating enzyme ATG10 n=1 Tax=Aspergillus saccharolyticus JOP 1030-1 TaxID=1450539 RepID=A0A318YZW9_9EURO|nr:autophagy-related protein Atg10 [Aspergillus saccharolyticus JOP 1030-1]PYH40535.1 autophagy-related protein Atg10 [Aspergillus saccharolyticus JOP 1030-1]